MDTTIRENFYILSKSESGKRAEGKFLVAQFEFEGRLGVSFEGDCHEVEVTPNMELLVTFGISLEGVCHELYI